MKMRFMRAIALCACAALMPLWNLPARAAEAAPKARSAGDMIARLEASDFRFNGKSYAGKKGAMIAIAGVLMENGYEPSFVAGVMGNVAEEGSFGKFENITGYTRERLLQVFPSLSNPNHSHNYIAHMQGFTEYDSCGHDHSEYRQYNGKYIYNGFSVSAVWQMLLSYEQEGWKAKFGLGSIQWTGSRTKTVVSFYLQEAGDADTITYDQCAAAEMKAICYELSHGYAYVYNNWKNANASALDTADAAYDAGSRVCRYYEVPSNRDARAVVRGNVAREIFEVMMPQGGEIAAPSSVTLESDRSAAVVGEAVSFSCAADVACDFTLVIRREGQAETRLPVTGQSISYAFVEPGQYTVHALAVNAAGQLESAPASVRVDAAMDLPDLTLPAGLVFIDEEAFMGTGVRVVRCPEGLIEIGARSFANCKSLRQVYIPDSVRTIAGNAFEGCEGFTVFGASGSLAELWAEVNGVPFAVIGG